ncbi:uncharacterized protein LOC109716961 [Ananas comosus]|uniref:Uncharacterized protein LOC109716961 n=1 Tax=Ananas comosus TaxID=4615 RepID=A0A6P5FR64_ANACO|nr:uncharacterized protein LOC109716961 [Ananas comosus]
MAHRDKATKKGVSRGGFIGTVAASTANVAAAAAATATIATTITTSGGHVVTVSDFISQFDEAAKSRLNRMNERLRELEQQIETLEAQIWKASDPFDAA